MAILTQFDVQEGADAIDAIEAIEATDAATPTPVGETPVGETPTPTPQHTGEAHLLDLSDAPTEAYPDLLPPRDVSGLPRDRAYPWQDAHIPYVERQLQAIELEERCDTSFCMHGGGGYGKTQVSVRMVINTYMRLEADDRMISHLVHKEIERPAVLVLAYTNNAVENLRERLPLPLQDCCMTIHKALGSYPRFVDAVDEEGNITTKQEWVWRYNENNKIAGLHTIYLDEATLPNLELLQLIYDACPPNVRIIPIGDLQQQKPPFGQAILAYLCTRIPNVVLNKPFRQDGESPVMRFLFDFMAGPIGCILPPMPKPPEGLSPAEAKTWKLNQKVTPRMMRDGYTAFYKEYAGSNDAGELDFTIYPDTKTEVMIERLTDFAWVRKVLARTKYDPADSTIIMPYKVGFGTEAMNRAINHVRAQDAGELTHQCWVGFNKHWYAIGDYVILDTRKYEVVGVELNTGYTGLDCIAPSVGMRRGDDILALLDDGKGKQGAKAKPTAQDYEQAERAEWAEREDQADADAEDYADYAETSDPFGLATNTLHDVADSASNMHSANLKLNQVTEDAEGRYLQISHVLTLRDVRTDNVRVVDTLKEMSNLIGGHATTSYKAQGLSFHNVIGFLHKSHLSLNREMVYTITTRTTNRVHFVCQNDTMYKATQRQTLVGNGGDEKIEALRLAPIQWPQSTFKEFMGMPTHDKRAQAVGAL